jgi:hypothetical protein
VTDLHTIIVITDFPAFIFFGIPLIIVLTIFSSLAGLQNYSNFLEKNQTVKKDNSIAPLSPEQETEKHNAYNPIQLLLISGLPFIVLIIVMFIPEYRELARVEFDGSKMYFKNVYGVMITKPTSYADILEVSTEHGRSDSKKIVVTTLSGDFIASHITDEKTIILAQSKILSELKTQHVQPFSEQR